MGLNEAGRARGFSQEGINREVVQTAAIRMIRPAVEYARRHGHIPGLAVSIAQGEEILLQRGYGIAGKERSVTADTPFRIGSITKLFTATAIMQLWERGKLELTAPIGEYLPWFPEASHLTDEPTIVDLLTHTGGLKRNVPGMKIFGDGDSDDVREKLQKKGAVIYSPLEDYKYSNMGYMLLGKIVQKLDGRPWREYFEQEIKSPLGLRKTYVDVDDHVRASIAQGYARYFPQEMADVVEQREIRPLISANAYAPAFGAISTVADINTFLSAHLPGNTSILSERAKEIMHADIWDVGNNTRALGFAVNHIGKQRILEHAGNLAGYRTYAGIDTDTGTIVVVFGNASAAPVIPMSQEIFNLVYHFGNNIDEYVANENHGDNYARYEGIYSGEFSDMLLLNLNGTLTTMDLSPTPQSSPSVATLNPTDIKDAFRVSDSHPANKRDLVEFERDAAGKVTGFWRDGELWERGKINIKV